MIFLTDNINENSMLVWHSLRSVRDDITGVSIACDGFLPEGFTSPYAFYTGDEEAASSGQKTDAAPLFFNQVPVPAYWQIRGTGNSAEVWDYEHLRARIFYADPGYRRQVRVVDWLDEEGKVRSCDCYNRYGRRMAQVIMDGAGHNITKTWYDMKGRETIYENVPAGEIILHDRLTDHGRTHLFHSLWEFVTYYLQQRGYDLSDVAYNSLATPFFVSRELRKRGIEGEDILFWQEEVGADLPGNMKVILNEIPRGGRTQKIAVQSETVYRKIQDISPSPAFFPLGYVYPFVQTEGSPKDILILTNSDQVEGLEKIVQALPEAAFHIGALTEMSPKLLSLARYANVDLRPNIPVASAGRLQDQCGIYLDINHGSEILHAVRTAFLHRVPVLAFTDTVHEPRYMDPAAVIPNADPGGLDRLIAAVRRYIENPAAAAQAVTAQEKAAMAMTKDTYKGILEQHYTGFGKKRAGEGIH